MNSSAKFQIVSITPTGVMSISVTGLSATQAKDIGLGGLVMSINAAGMLIAFGNINTGHVRTSVSGANGGNIGSATVAMSSLGFFVSVLQGVLPAGYWLSNGKVMTKVTKQRTANGGGKGNDRTYTVTVNEEVPTLTKIYNDGVTQRKIELQDALKFTADFYKELTGKYSQKASVLAQTFATQVKGKSLRNIDEALVAYERYRNSLGAKFGAKDRNAIINALQSVKYADLSGNLSKHSKALGYYGGFADGFGLIQDIINAFKTNNWRPVFVKLESLVVGKLAIGVTAFAFDIIAGAPLGIIGFALIIALVGALVDDSLMNSINSKLGI